MGSGAHSAKCMRAQSANLAVAPEQFVIHTNSVGDARGGAQPVVGRSDQSDRGLRKILRLADLIAQCHGALGLQYQGIAQPIKHAKHHGQTTALVGQLN